MTQLQRPQGQNFAASELGAALAACRRAFLAVALFSGMSNVLMLTGALFMLEIYDRVLPSRSVPTLVALLILAAGLYAAQGFIDAIRSRILVRVGHSLDEALSTRVYEIIVRLPLKLGSKSGVPQPIRDLDTVRGFLSGIGPVAFFDLPWMAIGVAIWLIGHFYIIALALAAQCDAIRRVAQLASRAEPTERPVDHREASVRPHWQYLERSDRQLRGGQR